MRHYWLPACMAAFAAFTWAQSAPDASGRWEGALKAPGQDVALQVDLARDAKGVWIGSLATPSQAGQDLPLGSVSVQGNAVRFSIAELPGAPVFEAKLNPQGTEMSGACSSGGRSMMFSLKRTGEAKVSLAPPSTQLASEFAGTWEGVIESGGSSLRLALQLSRKPDGSAAGSVVSLDQDNAKLGINTITQSGKQIEFEIRAVAGSYKGTLNAAATEIAGTWTQMGNSVPLTFKRKP